MRGMLHSQPDAYDAMENTEKRGAGGIRTHGPCYRSPAFKAGAFVLSATAPVMAFRVRGDGPPTRMTLGNHVLRTVGPEYMEPIVTSLAVATARSPFRWVVRTFTFSSTGEPARPPLRAQRISPRRRSTHSLAARHEVSASRRSAGP